MARGRPFQPGFDSRRHLLTQAERRKGYQSAPARIRARLRGLYRGGKIQRKGESVWREYESMSD